MALRTRGDGHPQQLGRQRRHFEEIVRARLERLDIADRQKTGLLVGHRLESVISASSGASVIGDEWMARKAASILKQWGFRDVQIRPHPTQDGTWIATGDR